MRESIAAHASDQAKGIPGARDWDDAMSRTRKAQDWEAKFSLAVDPEEASATRPATSPPRRTPAPCAAISAPCAP